MESHITKIRRQACALYGTMSMLVRYEEEKQAASPRVALRATYLIAATMMVLALPPRLSLRIHVSTESRKGTNILSDFFALPLGAPASSVSLISDFSAKAEMT